MLVHLMQAVIKYAIEICLLAFDFTFTYATYIHFANGGAERRYLITCSQNL
jgi:hypothetical protein